MSTASNTSMLRFFLRTVAISLSILSLYSSYSRIPYVDAFLQVRSSSLGGVRTGNGIRSKVDQQQRQGFQQNTQQRQSTLLRWNSYDVSWKKRYSSSSSLFMSPEDLALVLGQETYGFGIVVLAEGIYSFTQAPSLGQVKVLIPGILGAVRQISCNMIYCFVFAVRLVLMFPRCCCHWCLSFYPHPHLPLPSLMVIRCVTIVI
jgi:hypothetical protein